MYESYWWNREDVEGGTDLAETLVGHFKQLDEEQSYRREANLRNLRLYSNLAVLGLSSVNYSQDDILPANRLKMNVIQSVIDTSQALIATNRPRVQFLTQGGNYKMQRKAKNLTYFVDGQFYRSDVYQRTQEVFRDSAIFGTGFVKIYEEEGNIVVERVFPDEIVVDDLEGKYGKPRSMYQHKEVDRGVLITQFPEHKDDIVSAGRLRREDQWLSQHNSPIGVVEAWYLPSGHDTNDGRHVIAIEGATLLDESWEDTDFPFAVFRWTPRPLGFYGQSISEIIRDVQIEINYILQKIQRHLNLASTKIFMEKGAKINKQMTNEEMGVVEYAKGSRPPVPVAIQAISPEYYNQLERLYSKAFELVGISQMAAISRKEPGITAGVAIREVNDIQSQRFLHVGQAWERFHIAIAKQMIKLAKRIAERGEGSYKILAKDGNKLREITWEDVNLDEDSYIMQAFPTGYLPKTPGGRLQAVSELVTAFPQMQDEALRLLDFPDVESAMSRVNAPQEIMDMIVFNILEKSTLFPPEPFMDLIYGVKHMQNSYLRAKMEGVPEKQLEMFRQWMAQAVEMLTPPVPPVPPGPPPIEAAVPPPAPLPGEAMPAGMPVIPPGVPLGQA